MVAEKKVNDETNKEYDAVFHVQYLLGGSGL